MHRSPSGLALLVVASLLSLATPALAQERDAQGEQAMLDAINARRAAASLQPLSRDQQLDAAALLHSAEMADRNVLEHVSEQSGTPADRVHAAGLAIDELAENVAMHHSTDAAQQSLEQSAPHVANMTNDRFTHIGLAAVRDERGFYVTQVFGRIEPSGVTIGTAPQAELGVPEVPPPAVIAPEAPQVAPQVLEVAPQAQAQGQAQGGIALQASPGYAADVAPGTRATVMVPGPQGGVSGYWICAQSRWWYFPMPAGAQPGQHLSPDLSVTGAPPGYAVTGCIAGQTVQPLQPQAYAPPPPVYAPPQAYAPPPPVYYPPPPPRVYYPPPPPRVYYPQPPPRRRVIVMPPPGTVIAPYAPVYRGGGVRIEVGPRRGVRVERGWGRRR